jgi:hypothetical protein
MARVGRAIEKGATHGFMKVVADRETRKILGAAILGTGGDEAIHGLVDAMSAGLDVEAMIHAVPIHPTVSELIPAVLGEMKPSSECHPSRSRPRHEIGPSDRGSRCGAERCPMPRLSDARRVTLPPPSTDRMHPRCNPGARYPN